MINEKIFKMYDIRGIYNEDLDEDLAYKLGLAFANLRKKEIGKDKINIVVGGDMRLSTESLKKELINGITDGGADVIDIGLSSTPTFYFGVSYFNADSGIIVTASHNPGEWNGFKLTRDMAKPISGKNGIEDLKNAIIDNDLQKSDYKGKVSQETNTLEKQIENDFNFFDKEKISKLKVVIDPANGMGAQYTKALFDNLNCDVVKINFKLDGSFPAHEADPLKEENMEQLHIKVKEENADIGIALDGDGDRVFFVDDTGKTISQAIIRGILAQLFLKDKPGATICYDIRPGKITEDMILEAGGKPVVTKVGHSLIKETALKENAYFAGESSGHFFLNTKMGCFEVPIIVIGKLLQEFSESGIKVSEYIKKYDIYFHSGEINTTVNNKQKVLNAIEEKYKDGKINKLDGITVEYEDFWFNVRESNTEEKVRLNLEARTKKTMIEKRDEVLEIINS